MMLGSHVGSLRWQIQWWAFGQRHEMDLAQGQRQQFPRIDEIEKDISRDIKDNLVITK